MKFYIGIKNKIRDIYKDEKVFNPKKPWVK
jgi:hypothetical protein